MWVWCGDHRGVHRGVHRGDRGVHRGVKICETLGL